MPITILNQPEKVMLNGNPIVLGLQTDNQYSVVPVFAVGNLLFNTNAYPALNDTFSITIKGSEYIFTFKNDGATGTYEIERNNGGVIANQASWISQKIIPKLNQLFSIRENYKLSVEYNGAKFMLRLTARKSGTEWNLILTETSSITTVSTTDGVNGIIRENYKLFAEIYALHSNTKLATLESDVDADGKGYFRLDRVLVNEDLEHPNALNYGNTNAQVALNYTIYYGEKYGNPIVFYPSGQLGVDNQPLFALKGALSEATWPLKSFYENTINAAKPKFLNSHPRILTINRNQPLWLYYFFTRTSGGLRVRCKLYNSLGGNTIVTLSDTAINYTDRMQAINVSIAQHAAITNYANLLKYEIWLETQTGTVISETITYLITEVDYEFNKYFVFRNSLGGFDTIWTHGKSETNNLTDNAEVMLTVSGTATNIQAALANYGQSISHVIETNMGIKGREDAFDGRDYKHYFLDFLNSDLRFEIINGVWHPIVMEKQTVSIADYDTIYNQPFTYKYAYMDNGITPQWL